MPNIFSPYLNNEQRTTDAFGTLLHQPRGNPFGSLIPWAEQEAFSQSLREGTAPQASGASSTSQLAAWSAYANARRTHDRLLETPDNSNSSEARLLRTLKKNGTHTGPHSQQSSRSTEARERDYKRNQREEQEWDAFIARQVAQAEARTAVDRAKAAWFAVYGEGTDWPLAIIAWYEQETWPFPEDGP